MSIMTQEQSRAQKRLISILGRKPYKAREKVKRYEDVAWGLSIHGKKYPSWKWRYIHNVEKGKLKAGERLCIAIDLMYENYIPRKRHRVNCKDAQEHSRVLRFRDEDRKRRK